MCQQTSIIVNMTSKINNIKTLIGNKIRLERLKKRISQEKFAELADLSKNSIGAIERGEASPTIETLAKIAKALDMTISELTDFSKVDL